jgi:hypothetical protein
MPSISRRCIMMIASASGSVIASASRNAFQLLKARRARLSRRRAAARPLV